MPGIPISFRINQGRCAPWRCSSEAAGTGACLPRAQIRAEADGRPYTKSFHQTILTTSLKLCAVGCGPPARGVSEMRPFVPEGVG